VRRLFFATVVGAMLLNSASAMAAESASASNGDPWEHWNRHVYSFNEGLDRAIIRPAAIGYSRALPSPLRLIIRNFLSNLTEPSVIINDVLQVKPKRAAQALGRLVLNSTLGIAGLLDVAATANLPHQDTSFSITLGHYGVGTGPYIYLPVVGPSTVRALVGAGVGAALDPLYWIRYPDKTAISLSRTLVHGLDLRAESDGALKTLLNDATDPYATLRSAYMQNQQSLIDGDAPPVQSLPDFDETSPPNAHPAASPPPASDAPAPATTPEPAPAPAPTATTAAPAATPDPGEALQPRP